MVPRLSWCFGTPSATSLSSTIGSTSARTIYIHKLFFKDKSILSSFRVNQDALGHPRRPRQTQLWLVQHVPVMFIKIWHGTCFFTTLSKTDRLKTVPAYYRLIKMLSDTLSDLGKLNHWDNSNYLPPVSESMKGCSDFKSDRFSIKS